jgi:hypothetical protein
MLSTPTQLLSCLCGPPTTGAGTLDKSEAAKAVQAAGYRLDPPAFDALFRSFDPDRWAGAWDLLRAFVHSFSQTMIRVTKTGAEAC